MLISRILLPQALGQLTILQTTITLLAAVSSVGLLYAVTRQVAETRGSAPLVAGRYLGATLKITALGGALVTAAYLAANELVAAEVLQGRRFTNLVLASGGSIFFAALTGAIQGGLMGLERFGTAALSQWIQALATSVGLVVGALIADVEGALVGFSLGQLLSAASAYYLLRRDTRKQTIPIGWRLTGAEWRRLWRLALPAFVATITVAAALLGGQVLLAHQADGYADVAAFNVAYRWHLVLMFVPAAIAPVLLPIMTNLLSQGRAVEVRRLFRLNILLVLGLTAVPAAVFAIGSRQILSLNGPFYSAHADILIVLAIASIPSALNNVLSSASLSLGAIKAWLVSDLVFAAVFFGAAVGLISTRGAMGLALASLAAFLATDAALALPVWRRIALETEHGSLSPPFDAEGAV